MSRIYSTQGELGWPDFFGDTGVAVWFRNAMQLRCGQGPISVCTLPLHCERPLLGVHSLLLSA